MASSDSFCLTEHLLSTTQDEFREATQAPFLVAAAEGRLSKEILGRWLASDRLYIHAYIRACAHLLSSIDLPPTVPEVEAPETKLVDWIVEALAAARREERLFIDIAERYNLEVNLPVEAPGQASFGVAKVREDAKVPGLSMIQNLFGSIKPRGGPAESEIIISASDGPTDPIHLRWLEGAVLLWGTERVYLEAWSYAKSKQPIVSKGPDVREDADGGALRKEFIPNWTSLEFANFVVRLGSIIDTSVEKLIQTFGEDAKADILKRIEAKWKSLLVAEASFWPTLD